MTVEKITNPWEGPLDVPQEFEGRMVMLVAFGFPSDYRSHYVLRPFLIEPGVVVPVDPPFLFTEFEALVRAIPRKWTRLDRSPDDEKHVICSFI